MALATRAEDYRDSADDILRRPEFAEQRPGLVERALDWFLRQLGSVFEAVTGAGGGYLIGYTTLGLAALAALAAAYLLWRALPARRHLRPDDGDRGRTTTVVARSRAEWLAEADDAEASGEWDRAVHARYHGLTTGLADAGELAGDPSTTSGEHRRHFDRRAGRDRATAFRRASTTYEDVWFGGAEAVRDDARDLAALDRELVGTGGAR